MKKYIFYVLSCVVLLFVCTLQVHAQFDNVNLFNEPAPNNTTGGLLDVDTSLSNTSGANTSNTNTETSPTIGSGNQPANTESSPTVGSSNQNTNTETSPVIGSQNQNSKKNPKYLITNPLGKTTSLQDVILNVVKVVQILLMMAAVVYIIWAGFLFVTAKGDTAKVVKARNSLLWAMVGVALVLGAQVITTTIKNSVNSVFYDTTKK